MLQAIREHTQGWIASVIISIIILTFALWGIHSYFAGGSNNSIIAEVNGVEIMKEQVASVYERLRRQVQFQYKQNNLLSTKDEASLKQRALRELIDIEVLKQAATAQGFFISSLQVNNYLESMPDFQVNGQFSIEKFQQLLSSAMLTPNEFLELIRNSLLIDQPKLGIAYSAIAPTQEIDAAVALVNQNRDIAYLNIPFEYFLSKQNPVSTDVIRQYYDQHKSEFMTPEQMNIDYIMLSLPDLMKQITPTGAELQKHYQENTSTYISPMQWQLADINVPVAQDASKIAVDDAQKTANELYTAFEQGKDFASLSQDHLSIFSNKDWVTLNQVPAELQKSIAQLDKPNQISRPIRTKNGFVIIKALEVKQPQKLPYEAVAEKVKDSFAKMQAEEKFSELREQLADAAYEHPDSLEYAAKKLNLPIKTSGWFSKTAAGKDISQYKKVREIAFSHDVLNLQNNSDVIQVTPETAAVIRLQSHREPAVMPLAAVSNVIADKLRHKQAMDETKKLALELQTKMVAGEDSQRLALSLSFQWHTLGYTGRYANEVDPAILDMAFRMPYPQAKKVVYSIAQIPTGFAIIALRAVRPGSADAEQRKVFAEQIQNSNGLLEYELYKQSLVNKAKINIQ